MPLTDKGPNISDAERERRSRQMRAMRFRLGVENLISKLTERREWLDDDQRARLRELADR